MSLWSSYAYVTNSSDRWDALWHVMNMSDAPVTVYIQYKVGYVPASNTTASRPVTPSFMDVTGCGGSATFNEPGNGGPGSIFTKARTITAPWNGVAVYAAGHLYDGGIDIGIKRDSTGQVGCTSVPRYDVPEPMDFPSSITPCVLHDFVTAGEDVHVGGALRQHHAAQRRDGHHAHVRVEGIPSDDLMLTRRRGALPR